MNAVKANIARFLTRLHNGEHVKAIADVVELSEEDVETIPEAKPKLEALRKAVEHEKLLFKLSPESPETKEIAAYNIERDQAWREVRRLLKFYAARRNPVVKAAAGALQLIIKNHNDVLVINLYEETGNIRHALNDFHKPEHEPFIQLIPGLSELIAILENANTELDKHYIQRLQDAEEAKKLGKLGNYRKHVDALLISFLHALNTVYNYNEMKTNDPVTKATIQRIGENINALFTQLKKNLSRRSL